MKKTNNSAITLIALVITIIVMLILAGVTISFMTSENGILSKSQEAKELANRANAKEEILIKIDDFVVEFMNTNPQFPTLEDFFQNKKSNDAEIEELYLLYTKASVKDDYSTTANGKAKYAVIKLKKYTYEFSISENFKVNIIDNTISGDIPTDTTPTDGIEKDEYLTTLFSLSNSQLEFKDIISGKTLLQKVLNSESAIDYIMSNKDSLTMIKNNEELTEVFLNNAYVQQKLLENTTSSTIKGESLIPEMTSNTTPSGIASCSSRYGSNWDAWMAFCNMSYGDGWYPTETPAWLEYEFETEQMITTLSLKVTKEFSNTAKFQYSTDGINWIDLTDYKSYTGGSEIEISINQIVKTKYIRMYLTSGVRVYKFQCYGINYKGLLESYIENAGTTENTLEKLVQLAGITKITIDDIMDNLSILTKVSVTEESAKYILATQELANKYKLSEKGIVALVKSDYVQQRILSKTSTESELIPQMTSNTTPLGIASCSSFYGTDWDAWIAFNNKTSGDGWYPTTIPAWIQYEFNSPVVISKFLVNLGSTAESVGTSKFQYSTDGENWTDATDYKNYNRNTETTETLSNKVIAKYIRLNYTTGVRLYKFQTYGQTIDSSLIFN